MKTKTKLSKNNKEILSTYVCKQSSYLYYWYIMVGEWQDKSFKLYSDLQPCRVKQITIVTLAQRRRKRKRTNEQHTYFESSL